MTEAGFRAHRRAARRPRGASGRAGCGVWLAVKTAWAGKRRAIPTPIRPTRAGPHRAFRTKVTKDTKFTKELSHGPRPDANRNGSVFVPLVAFVTFVPIVDSIQNTPPPVGPRRLASPAPEAGSRPAADFCRREASTTTAFTANRCLTPSDKVPILFPRTLRQPPLRYPTAPIPPRIRNPPARPPPPEPEACSDCSTS
jgi:hypothetical protein